MRLPKHRDWQSYFSVGTFLLWQSYTRQSQYCNNFVNIDIFVFFWWSQSCFFFHKIITILLLKQSYIFVGNFVIPISLFVITILLLKQSYLSMQQSCYDNVVPGNLNILTFLLTLAIDIVVFRNVIVVVFVFVGEVLVQKKNKNVNVAKKKKKISFSNEHFSNPS